MQNITACQWRKTYDINAEYAQHLVAAYVEHYTSVRLHSAIGYITPQAKLEGQEVAIFAERQHRLAQARAARLTAYQIQHTGRAA